MSHKAPQEGGCWFCYDDEDDYHAGKTLVFDTEFDTNVHIECIEATLQREPDHPEAVFMKYLVDEFWDAILG